MSRPIPCQPGRNRASASGSTGSTARRRCASVRRRTRRSTSGSIHSRPLPPGRNAPSISAPSAASSASAGPASTPSRSRSSSAVNGPWPRACRITSRRSASGTGSRNAAGTPGGIDTPAPSRYRPASSAAISRRRPAIRTSTARRSRISCAAATGPSAGTSPVRRRRSCSWSADSASRRCSSDSTSLIASASSSSRRSPAVSSSASSARSSISACARRSASGVSPSYM